MAKSHEWQVCEVPSYPHRDNVCAIWRCDELTALDRWADDVTPIAPQTFQVVGQSRDDVPKVVEAGGHRPGSQPLTVTPPVCYLLNQRRHQTYVPYHLSLP